MPRAGAIHAVYLSQTEAAVAYVDPGSFATDFSGGAAFGHTPLWVTVATGLAEIVGGAIALGGVASGLVRDPQGFQIPAKWCTGP